MSNTTQSGQDLVGKIGEELARQLLSPRIMLGRCQTLDQAKDSMPFLDNTHLPFYYYLGKYLPRDSVINVGLGLGLPLVCYLMARPLVLELCVQQDAGGSYYHPRLALANLRTTTRLRPTVFVGSFTDQSFHANLARRQWGAAVICGIRTYDATLMACERLWEYLQADGYVCLEGIGTSTAVASAFDNFCTIMNREGITVASRYGHGFVFKE